MLISHEVPLDLLDVSLTFNDYDYLLPHYYVKYPKYKEFYLKSKEKGRTIIMDNGLFEGGVFPDKELISIINEIKPNIFIVPDAWNDNIATLENAKKWMRLKPQLPKETDLMVVMQGRTLHSISTLYGDCCNIGYKHFAFNHSSKAYSYEFSHPNKQISAMMGRVYFISKMLNDGPLKIENYHHLLGCSLPQEVQYYGEYDFIKSIDTSNPVILGAQGIKYGCKLIDKPKEKIEEFMEKDLASNLKDIIFNINSFKQWSI